MTAKPRLAFIFSGIGTQWPGMGMDCFDRFPAFRQGAERLDEAFFSLKGWHPLNVIRGTDSERKILDAATGHPCVMTLQFGLLELLTSWGIRPDAVIGHSGGEVTAAVASGAITITEAARIIAAHSDLLTRFAGQGAMAHIALSAEEIQPWLTPSIECAAFNSPEATVLSGPRQELTALIARIEAAGHTFCRILKVDVPFHTSLLTPGLDDFEAALQGLSPRDPALPVYSSCTGRRESHGLFTPAYWRRHVRSPVAFRSAVDTLLQDGPFLCVEISPHPILLDAIGACADRSGHTADLLGTLTRDKPSLPLLASLLFELESRKIPVDWALSGLERPRSRSTADTSEFQALREEERFGKMQILLEDLLQELSDRKVTPNAGITFREMGVTSLMALRIKNALEERLGLSLSAALLFNYPDIPSLTGFLLQTLRPDEPSLAESARKNIPTSEPLAVIGMGCRLPGGAASPEALWNLLTEGRDVICEVPGERWNIDRYYDPDPAAPGKMHNREGGFLQEPIDLFDAQFFNLSAREARQLDPQQRLLCEVAWEAFEDGGIDISGLRGTSTGLFLAISSLDYSHAHRDSYYRDRIDAYSLTGTTFSAASGRLSYLFGFEGPCFAVDTACSSSLVAVHQACRSLRSGESSMAVVAGVNLMLIPDLHICFTKLGATAPDGRSKSFDDSANGYGRGEGAAVLLIKRLSDANRDGNRVLALIRGSAINQDGRSNGLTAPNGLAQQKVIGLALADAALTAHEISYVEAHGTGTALGDSIELDAMAQAYCTGRPASSPLQVGSVKSNIGHLEAAAGMAGMVKLVKCLQHQSIPANIHIKTPNTHFAWDRFALTAPTTLTPWMAGSSPRRAGISAFGFSGTNGHAILEEAPAAAPRTGHPLPVFLMPFSARSAKALSELAGRTLHSLTEKSREETGDLCFTSSIGRPHFEWRGVVFGTSPEELATQLKTFRAPESSTTPRRLTFAFTGQGSQYPGMGRGLYEAWPVFREALDACAEILTTHNIDLLALLYRKNASEETLARTEYAQPVIASVEYALFRLWYSWGVKADAVIGHSIGEFPAAVASGVMSLATMLGLVVARGHAMSAYAAPGAMLAVMAPKESVLPLLNDLSLSLAAENAPAMITLAGPEDAIHQARARLEAKGISSRPLRVSGAFHSPAMKEAREHFRPFLAQAELRPAGSPRMISSVSGLSDPHPFSTADYWADQITSPVAFRTALEAASGHSTLFLEIGGTSALTPLMAQTLPQSISLASLNPKVDAVQAIFRALGELYTAGVAIDWNAVYAPFMCRRCKLPNYPFQRQSYWMEVCVDPPARLSEAQIVPGLPLTSPALGTAAVFEMLFNQEGPDFLHEHIIYGRAISPAAGHIATLLAVARALWGSAACDLRELEFLSPLLVLEGESRLVQVIVDNPTSSASPFRLVSRNREDRYGEWLTHCTGEIRRGCGEVPAPAITPEDSRQKTRFQESVTSDAFYADFIGAGYELGDGFLRIEDIHIGTEESFCRVKTRRGTPSEALHVIYPGAVDSILQTMLPSFLHTYMKEMLDEGATLIPMHMDRVRFFHDVEAYTYCHARTTRIDDTVIRGDIMAMNSKGLPVVAMDGILMRKTNRETLYRQLAGNIHDMLYTTEFLNTPVSPAATPPVILVADSSSALAGRFSELLGSPVLSSSLLTDAGELRNTLTRTPQAQVLFLCGAAEETSSREEGRLCRDALRLIERLDQGKRLWIITEDSAPMAPAATLHGCSLWGLARTLAAEAPEQWGGILDLERDAGRESLLTVAALISTDGTSGAIRNGRFLEYRLRRLTAAATKKAPAPRRDSAYLITGGFGALGLTTARWLAENGAECIILAGRTVRAATAGTEIDALRSQGCRIEMAAADMADSTSVETLIHRFGKEWPPLDGVFHAAGILDDAMIPDQSEERFHRVMQPKVDGAWNLHRATAGKGLQFFVLYSSAATILGSQGQANYAAANQFMNTLAHHRRAGGDTALSICWGPWEEAGMAAEDNRRGARLATLGILGIKNEAAFSAMELLLAQEITLGCVMPMDWMRFAGQRRLPAKGFFQAVIKAEWTAGQETQQAATAIQTALAESEPDGRERIMRTYLAGIACEVLGFGDASQILPDQPLMEQGMDSLMAVDVRNRLSRELGQTLPAAMLFNFPTLSKLAPYLISVLTPQDEIKTPSSLTPPARPKVETADDLLSEIEGLIAE